jgi:NAD(P)H-hydrate epimerase
MFGYKPSIYYPQQTDKDLYKDLVKQCRSFDIPFVENLTENLGT